MRLSILFFGLLMFSGVAMTQEGRGFRYHDSLTYNLWLENRWKELPAAGKEAISEGHDYYYMRMRMGIAWYERSFYATAASHFRKALEYNEYDPVAIEYLYYCHLLTGEYGSASRLLETMSPEHAEKVLNESRLARNTAVLSFYYNKFDVGDIVSSPASSFVDAGSGTTTVTRLLTNPAISLSHYLSPGVYYHHSFNNIGKTSLLHYYDGIRTINLSDHKVMQNQYYGSFTISGKRGFSFSPYAHLALVTYDYIYPGWSQSSGFYAVYRANALHYSAGMNLRKRSGFLALDAGLGVNGFGNGTAIQGEAGLMVYPFGNSKFYAGGRVSGVLQPDGLIEDISPVVSLRGGISFPRVLSVDITAIEGDFRNLTTGNGLYLFNSPDRITRRLLINISVPAGTRSGLVLFAGGGLNHHQTERYTPDNQLAGDNIIKFMSYNINGGLSWNF